MRKTTLLAVSALALTGLSASALATTVVVGANTNIFASGFGSTSGVGDGSGVAPGATTFASGANQALTFSSVTGTVNCGTFCTTESSGPTSNGPDGTNYNGMQTGATNISGVGNGISGISFNGRMMFLVGVFLDNNTPSGAGPTAWAYNTNYADNAQQFSPGLGQVFYVGDGYTGSANQGSSNPLDIQQTFFVPSTATRLYLGFADAMGFVGSPGTYNDNVGNLTANFSINSVVAAPEPGSVMLMGLGLAGLAYLRRRLA